MALSVGTKVAALASVTMVLFGIMYLNTNVNTQTALLLRGKISLTGRMARHDTSSTVADASSPHNYENREREACDFERHGEGLVHVAVSYDWWNPLNEQPEKVAQLQSEWKKFVDELPEYAETKAADARGRGVVYAAGSESFTNLVLSVRMLRSLGCTLPVEVWHFRGELNDWQLRTLRRLGATPRDVLAPENFIQLEFNKSMAKPYDIKPTSLLNSAFEEALFLDADNLPVSDPTYLFDRPEFKTTGAMMFADFWQTDPRNPIYKIMGVPCWREREVESGQIVVNKRLAWKALNLAWYMNRNHPVYYSMLFGDKDTFRFAWKALGQPYHLVRWAAAEVGHTTDQEKQFCGHTLGHHDPDGKILFLHTHLLKWSEWKGQYPWTHFRDQWNGFSVQRPWTHAQELRLDVLNMTYTKPTWFHGWPQLRCLQYVRMQLPEDLFKTVQMQEGDPNKAKEVLPSVPFADVVDADRFYQHFEDAEGPMLQVAPY